MRGQAALEYLMTYGWAFMVVLVMIGGLSYLGVTNTNTLIPEQCRISLGFGCEDFRLTKWDGTDPASEVSLILKNNMKTTAYLNRVTMYYDDQISNVNCGGFRPLGTYPTSDNGVGADYLLNPGERAEVVCNDGAGKSIIFPLVGEKEKLTFEFTYKLTLTGFNHSIEGEIVAVVQPQS